MKSYGKRNAITGGKCLGSECSDTINRKGLVLSAVNNSYRVLPVNEKRVQLNTFVKIINVVAAKMS